MTGGRIALICFLVTTSCVLEVPSAPATRISGGGTAELRGDRGLLVDPLETGNQGQGLFEMDIVLTEADRQRHRRGVTGENDRIWPNAIIPYDMPSYISSEGYKLATQGMAHWMNHTCIKFKERENEKDYIKFVEIGGCWSSVGRVGGEQLISLGSSYYKTMGCGHVGVVIHELAHVAGFWHEQSRPDRDQYITIITGNIHPAMLHNFETYPHLSSSLKIPYDYDSITHYNSFAFSMNGWPTIIPKKKGAKIGQRVGLSELDIKQAVSLYNCGARTTSVDTQAVNLEVDNNVTIVIQNKFDLKCLAHYKRQVTMATCNISSPAQQWVWSKYSQIINKEEGLCLSYSNNTTHLTECDPHMTDNQEWACGGLHLMQPSEGVCLSGRSLPTDDEVDQLLLELAAFVAEEPVQRGLPTCNLDQLDQQWTVLQSPVNSTTGGSVGNPVCAFSPEHNLTEWYTVNTSDANGWLSCHRINTFAQGLVYRDGVIRGLTCRASPNMFSGKQHSTKQPGNETCTNTTVTMGTHFHCQKGYYLKSVNIDSGRVTCCNDHTQQDYTLPCQTLTVPMVTGAEKVQLCTSSGYYVVYSNKECPVHDACHNVVKCCY